MSVSVLPADQMADANPGAEQAIHPMQDLLHVPKIQSMDICLAVFVVAE